MTKPTKAHAIDRIRKALDAIPGLMQMARDSQEFVKWHRNTEIAIENTFINSPRHLEEFREIGYSPLLFMGGTDNTSQKTYVRGLKKASAVLQSMLEEIREYWLDEVQGPLQSERPGLSEPIITNKVFVIHGRDEEAKQTVARFLEGLGLKPVILQEQPSRGNTIIEKFEEQAQLAYFAVALCTPDDVGALANEKDHLKSRMRQNVVFELGYFAGAIGRNRVCALLKGDIERPSDYDGVIYIQLDEAGGWKLSLARELKSAGLSVDLNNLL